jgi:cyclic 2,3-diphosphoglycerate synthetase
MGRGGPPEPTVVEAGSVDLDHLIRLVASGEHAASDYLEDAVTTGVTTVGARRAGGGLAGAPYLSNVREAAEMAASLEPGLLILEGSGAAIPTLAWDAGVLVVPASAPPEYLGGYLGPYRLLRSDLVVVTMASGPTGPENLSALRSHVRRYLGDASFIATNFAPVPLEDVRGKEAFFATTAPPAVVEGLIGRLEADHGCSVVGWSARLADRAGLAEDLDAVQGYDVLLTELKAAAVDIGVAKALERGAEVVFVDNRAEAAEGSVDLETALGGAIDLALDRAGNRR